MYFYRIVIRNLRWGHLFPPGGKYKVGYFMSTIIDIEDYGELPKALFLSGYSNML